MIKRMLVGLLLVALALGLVACGGAEDRQEEGVLLPPVPMSPGGGEGVEYSNDSLPVTVERMIVRSGEMELVVEDVAQAAEDIAQLAAGLGGYVVSSYISGEEEDMRGWISFRVPDDQFETAMAQLGELAVRVKSERTYSQDVTEEYIDLQARLKNAEATEEQYLALLEQAVDVDDILSIYDSLNRIRAEIEQIEGRIQYLERTTSTSLISVTLEPEVTAKPLVRVGWNVLEVLKAAARGLVIAGQALATIAIWLLIFIPIWGTILGIILWRYYKRKKAKKAKK